MPRKHDTKCATPGCRSERGHGQFGSFCEPCAARLKDIKERWDAERAAGRRRGFQDDEPAPIPVAA